MAYIKVDLQRLSQLESQIDRLPSCINSASIAIKYVRNELDWDVACEDRIDRRLRVIANDLDDYKQRMQKIVQFLNDTIEKYEKLETSGMSTSHLSPTPNITSSNINTYTTAKSFILNEILPNLIPPTSLIYITSGIAVGKNPFIAKNTESSSVTYANKDWLGYEYSNGHPGVTAWIGKASASAKNDIGNANINAYLGKFDAQFKADVGIFKDVNKNEYKNGEWEPDQKTEYLYAELGGGINGSILSLDGATGIGNDMLGLGIGAEGGAGNVKLETKGKFSIEDKGVNAYAEAEALVSAAEGKVYASFDILGIEVKAGIGGYAGALGVEGTVGIKENAFVLDAGAAAGMGVSGSIEIGLNDEGWENFIDFVTF